MTNNQRGKGRLYGIGVGPGDPELLTLKALRILQSVPVLAYQSAEDKNSTARGIIASHLLGNQIEVGFHFPRAQNPELAKPLIDRAIAPIEAYLDQGMDVAVVCMGDPMFYGSFMYLYTRLSDSFGCGPRRFSTEIVPGICSPMASAAVLGVPLSYRNDIFSVLSATLPVEILEAQLVNADAVAIIKLSRHFEKVRSLLNKLGMLNQAQYIERATMSDQKIMAIADVDAADVPYFSMILVPSKMRF
jgi:precorrin-2/cobalt-factor-2 C20-methyltransferase